jgi:membrane protein DedA with SNARE-associated domain
MNQLFRFLAGHAEAVLFAAIFAEQIGLPLPAVPILLAAGALIADGVLNPVAAVGITVVASVLADLIWFYLGRRGGGRLLRFFCKISLCDSASFEKTERLFAEHGMSAVTGAKFVPWLGLLIPPMAGAFRVSVGKFLAFDALGSLLYGMVYLGLGFLFDSEINRVVEFVRHFGLGTAALISLLAAVFVCHKHVLRRKAATSAPATSSTSLAAVPRA